MDYLHHSSENLPAQKRAYYLERSRRTLLNFGYDYIVFKTKMKKKFGLSKSGFNHPQGGYSRHFGCTESSLHDINPNKGILL